MIMLNWSFKGYQQQEKKTFCWNAEQSWAKYTLRQLSIPNPYDQNDIQEQEKP